jgi:DNA-binding NarL/FixJ family response regulator
VRVVVAEDSGLLRDALTRLLWDYGIEVVAAVGSVPALRAAAAQHRPDAYVLDVRMPPTFTDEGIRAAIELRSGDESVPVLVLSQDVEERYARDLFASGSEALGYLLKDRVTDGAEFVDSLRRVAAGAAVLDPDVVRQLLVRSRAHEGLTPRELEVLSLMAEGRSNAGIARALVVTEGAVEKHVRRIFQELRLPPSSDENRRVLAVLSWLGLREPS